MITLANSVEKPRSGAKLILDVTANALAASLNKGLNRAARMLNLYGVAGLKASGINIVVMLHGEAARSVLNGEFSQTRFGVVHNSNLPLIREL